ncbi:uncharacterized protein LOC144123242 [Amblyomma americanum]
MEDIFKFRPHVTGPKDQETVQQGSQQAVGGRSPAVAKANRKQKAAPRKRRHSKDHRRRRTSSVCTATTADSSCFLKPVEQVDSLSRTGGKQDRSATDAISQPKHTDPSSSISQAKTTLEASQVELDESMCPLSSPMPLPPVTPVLSPQSPSFHVAGGALEEHKAEPGDDVPTSGTSEIPWSPVSVASFGH